MSQNNFFQIIAADKATVRQSAYIFLHGDASDIFIVKENERQKGLYINAVYLIRNDQILFFSSLFGKADDRIIGTPSKA